MPSIRYTPETQPGPLPVASCDEAKPWILYTSRPGPTPANSPTCVMQSLVRCFGCSSITTSLRRMRTLDWLRKYSGSKIERTGCLSSLPAGNGKSVCRRVPSTRVQNRYKRLRAATAPNCGANSILHLTS